MITHTQQIVWSIVSCQPSADLSPTSRQSIADQSQPISNQLAINCQPVADWSPIFRDSFASQSPIDLQPKNEGLITKWLHWLQLFFSCKAVTDRLQYMCDWGFTVQQWKLECLHSENTLAASWLPILWIHIRSHVIARQSQSYKFQNFAKNSNFRILQ